MSFKHSKVNTFKAWLNSNNNKAGFKKIKHSIKRKLQRI